MLSKHFTPGPIVVACSIAIGLGGCVAAVPLGQMAAQQMAPVKPACTPASGCSATTAAGSIDDVSTGLTASLRTLTSGVADTHAVGAGTSVK